MIYYCQKGKNELGAIDFVLEKNTLNLKNRASLNLLSEFSQLVRFLKEQVRN